MNEATIQVIWDGECDFCRDWIDHWRGLVPEAVEFRPYQRADELLLKWDLEPEDVQSAVWVLLPNENEKHRGAKAVAELLRRSPRLRHRAFAKALRWLPGFAAVADTVYGAIAARRTTAARLTRLLWGKPHDETFAVAQLLFTRLLAMAAFAAFASMWVQVTGLVGEHGILPAQDFLAEAIEWGKRADRNPHLAFPTLFWWMGASDLALRGIAFAGMLSAAMIFFGIASRFFIAIAWVCYLSLVSVGQIFLGYQWDALLLEALVVAWFFVPRGFRPRIKNVPESVAGRWLVWILVAKLMFLAGYVKIDADPAWRDLSALNFHFWTQPIPNSLAWWIHKLPDFVKSLGVLFTFVAELIAPLFIFAPRRLRHAAALVMIALQLAIMSSGTYGFFNLLSIALCVSLLDDRFFGRWGRFMSADVQPERAGRTIAVMLTVGILVASAPFLSPQTKRTLAPLRTFNSYGLFAMMTKERPEVSVQWSNDGVDWTEYDFHYKATAIDEPLKATTFHMPRLDWQLWFAALRGCQNAQWLFPFAERLLHAEPEVHALLEGGHPPDAPRLVRLVNYSYQFGEDSIWVREDRGQFCPAAFALDEYGALIAVRPQ